jgi:IS30 family transposase
LEANIYFAHLYASWERGINKNTNGLTRQYYPKGMDFNEVNDKEIENVMYRLNHRPRASQNNRSPNELFLGQRVDLLAA